MDIRDLILKILAKNGRVKVIDVVKNTGFSRSYINRFFRLLKDEGQIILIGSGKRSFYTEPKKEKILEAKKTITSTRRILSNKNLSEDAVLDELKRESGIFIDLSPNVSKILNYAFTEMLNNAIEHSKSEYIEIRIQRLFSQIKVDISDKGIGIFNNIIHKKNLKNELEAIQDLLKGKQTTDPQHHSGEGIFFTSKAVDVLNIQSSTKKLMFNNIIDDIFIENVKNTVGTRVTFVISEKTSRELDKIFKDYTGESYEFSKTSVAVKLYKMGDIYVSRSQARRILSGLDKFKFITLDFNHIKIIGQGFADEIFRVWKNHNPGIQIVYINAKENIEFMIKRALSGEHIF